MVLSNHVPRADTQQPCEPGPCLVTTLRWPCCRGYRMLQALARMAVPSVHLPPQPCLSLPWTTLPQALRHGQCASPVGPSSTCLLTSLGSSPQRADSRGPPCPAWTACTAGLVHLGHSYSLGVPAQQPWLSCAPGGCFLPGNCEPALSWPTSGPVHCSVGCREA